MKCLRTVGVLCGALSTGACSTMSGVMLVGDVVNAAGTAYLEHRDAERRRPLTAAEQDEFLKVRLEGHARRGNADAQYRLGLFHDARRSPNAQAWICRAAGQGHPQAQLLYGHWHSERRLLGDMWPYIDIPPDNGTAYVWYSLASVNGESLGDLFRERLVEHAMTPAELADANARLEAWTTPTCDALQASADTPLGSD